MNNQHNSPLTGEYLRAFERHATKNDPKRGGATVPCWEIVAYAADILDIAARKLGDNLDMCRLARSLGIDKIVFNSNVQMLKPSQYGIITIYADNKTAIVLRDELEREEKRFTLAHEIGHYCLHVRNLEGNYFIWNRTTIEQEAEIFAAALMYLLDQRTAQRAAHAA